MNPLVLWIPGSLLILAGVLLLVLGRLDTAPALSVIAVGLVIESAGVFLWARDRIARNPRRR